MIEADVIVSFILGYRYCLENEEDPRRILAEKGTIQWLEHRTRSSRTENPSASQSPNFDAKATPTPPTTKTTETAIDGNH